MTTVIGASSITYEKLVGKQKVALLLMSLDVETASKVFRQIEPHEVESIAIEIANLQGVRSQVIDQVIEEFYELMTAQEFYIEGGVDYAHTLLEKTFGSDRARE